MNSGDVRGAISLSGAAFGKEQLAEIVLLSVFVEADVQNGLWNSATASAAQMITAIESALGT